MAIGFLFQFKIFIVNSTLLFQRLSNKYFIYKMNFDFKSFEILVWHLFWRPSTMSEVFAVQIYIYNRSDPILWFIMCWNTFLLALGYIFDAEI